MVPMDSSPAKSPSELPSVGVSVDAVPHDLFKVVRWRGHAGRRLIEKEFPVEAKGKYNVDSRSLEEVMHHHHYRWRTTPEPWALLWIYADSLSTVAARFRLEYDYWYQQRTDPFFVRVYGDIREWNKEKRESLHREIKGILIQHCDKEDEHARAFRELNDLLGEFPADSRFPFTSLKTHHWLTQALHDNKVFASKTMVKSVKFESVYLVRISIAEPEFHKLKDLRSVKELRFRILQLAQGKLKDRYPLQIGDDLFIVCMNGEEVGRILQVLNESGFGYDVDYFDWEIKRTRKATRPSGKSQTIYVVKDPIHVTSYSVGVYEEFEYAPEKKAEYADLLEGKYEYVAWVSARPQGDMKKIAEEFLNLSEKEVLQKRYGEQRLGLKEKVTEPKEYLSPELALSIAEGYNEFLLDCERTLAENGHEACSVVKSFGEAWFVMGLKEPADAFWAYTALEDKKEKNLHMPCALTVVTAKPKYPFWRILELSKSVKEDSFISIVGEKKVELTEWHAKLIRDVVPFVQRERKRQFYRIVNAACRDSKEVLKVKIDGLVSERKLRRETAFRLQRLVEDVAEAIRRSGGNEDSRKRTTCEIFKILRMFTQ